MSKSFLNKEKKNTLVYKMHKIVKFCKKGKNRLIQVFHIENAKKGGKNDDFEKFSTLSTLKHKNSGDYSLLKKEQTFCGLVIKFAFCRKKGKKILTFKESNIKNKFM